jgi:PhnB protein
MLPAETLQATSPREMFVTTGDARFTVTAESLDANKIRPSVAPMLSVRNGARAVDFYKAAFGAQELFKVEAPDGAVVAQLSVGESEFWSPTNLPRI